MTIVKKLKKKCYLFNTSKAILLYYLFNFYSRMNLMKKANPKYVLRNWMVQSAIEKAENNDFSEVHLLYKVLSQPYIVHPEAEALGYSNPPPSWSKDLVVSCSS